MAAAAAAAGRHRRRSFRAAGRRSVPATLLCRRLCGTGTHSLLLTAGVQGRMLPMAEGGEAGGATCPLAPRAAGLRANSDRVQWCNWEAHGCLEKVDTIGRQRCSELCVCSRAACAVLRRVDARFARRSSRLESHQQSSRKPVPRIAASACTALHPTAAHSTGGGARACKRRAAHSLTDGSSADGGQPRDGTTAAANSHYCPNCSSSCAGRHCEQGKLSSCTHRMHAGHVFEPPHRVTSRRKCPPPARGTCCSSPAAFAPLSRMAAA